MKELSISQEKLDGSISATASYRGSATSDLLLYYENLFLHLKKMQGLFKTGEDYLRHCKETVQDADNRIAAEVKGK